MLDLDIEEKKKTRSHHWLSRPRKTVVGPWQLELDLIYEKVAKKVSLLEIQVDEIQTFLLEDSLLFDFIEGDNKGLCNWRTMSESISQFFETYSSLSREEIRQTVSPKFLQSIYRKPIMSIIVEDPYFKQMFVRDEVIHNIFGAYRYVQEELKEWNFSDYYCDTVTGDMVADVYQEIQKSSWTNSETSDTIV